MNFSRQLLTTLLIGCLLLTGCDTPQGDSRRRLRQAEQQNHDDNFQIATEYLWRFGEHELAYGQRNAVYHLNRWLDEQQPPADWQVDPLVRRLPRALQSATAAQQYDRMSFDSLDGRFLWEAAMCERIATWSLERAQEDPLLVDWYRAMEGTHGADHVHRLKTAARLFDWTVRNIQLDPLLKSEPSAAARPQSPTEQQAAAAVPAALRGAPGPGYRFEPWEVLLYGRGDAWQRARVFIRLARQQQLDVVMLAVDDPAGRRPWLPALLLDGQLYLFDTALGVPLPGADAVGIATLDEVLENPELLRWCDVEGHPYPIQAEHLQGLEVLIDAAPSELSHRMALAEANFRGERKLRLSVDPSALAGRLRQVKGVSNVRIWPIALEAILYREQAPAVRSKSPQLQADYIAREFIFTTPVTLVKGRWQHLAGNFDAAGPGNPGAKQLYLDSRHSEGAISQLARSRPIQREFGLTDELTDDPQRRAHLLRSMETLLRQSAHNASYWLGLINYEEGKPQVALDWFQRQTLGSRADTIWDSGANYQVGRCYEQLDELEKALATYWTAADSPSQAGELVRAKLLEERFGK